MVKHKQTIHWQVRLTIVVLAPEELIKRSTPFLLVGAGVVTVILIASDRLTPSVH